MRRVRFLPTPACMPEPASPDSGWVRPSIHKIQLGTFIRTSLRPSPHYCRPVRPPSGRNLSGMFGTLRRSMSFKTK